MTQRQLLFSVIASCNPQLRFEEGDLLGELVDAAQAERWLERYAYSNYPDFDGERSCSLEN